MTGTERGDSSPTDERSHDVLLRGLAVAILARGVLSLADAASLTTTGVGFVQLGGIAQADSSPLWALLWGSTALISTVLLARRKALGWLFGASVCIAYLVVGVTHAVMLDANGGALPLGIWLVFLADIAVPAIVLAGLFTVRPWFLVQAQRGRPAAAGRQPAPGPASDGPRSATP